MSSILPNSANGVVSVPASSRIALYSDAPYTVVRVNQYTNQPSYEEVLFNGSGTYTSSVFTVATTINIQGGSQSPVYYSVGTGAVVTERQWVTQGDPGTLNATGTLTAALVLGGIVTSTTAAGVTATLDTGTIFDAASTFAVNEYVVWTAINTGPNAFTVTAGTGHTVVGAGAVAAGTSGRFMTRKTAANTFVTYRLS